MYSQRYDKYKEKQISVSALCPHCVRIFQKAPKLHPNTSNQKQYLLIVYQMIIAYFQSYVFC